MDTAKVETAKTTEPSTSTAPPSIKWIMKLKLKAAHQVLAMIGVTEALIDDVDREKWAKTYELLVGAPPPKA